MASPPFPQLLGFLAGEVLDLQLQHAHAVPGGGDFLLQAFRLPRVEPLPQGLQAARFSPSSSSTRTCPKAMTLRNRVVYFSATTWSWPMTQKEHFPSRRMASSLWPALAQWKYSFPLWYT